MTSLNEALKQALDKQTLDAWDKDDQPKAKGKTAAQNPHYYFKETNGVTRAVFNMVRDNPGITRGEANIKLVAQGYKEASTTSIISQMVRGGAFRKVGNGLFVAFSEYRPLKSREKFKRKTAIKDVAKPVAKAPVKLLVRPKAAPKADTAAGIAALSAIAEPPKDWYKSKFDPNELVDTLTVKQARAVYDALKQIFGG